MKLNKSMLVAALSLLAASGLMAKENSKKEEIPGAAPQPASYFYTGKPYDADLGTYTFKYRNYDPEVKRWTVADPSGFPDGANNYLLVNNKTTSYFDAVGLDEQWIYGTYTATDGWEEKSGFSLGYTGFSISLPLGIEVSINPGYTWSLNSSITTTYKGQQPGEVQPPTGYHWANDVVQVKQTKDQAASYGSEYQICTGTVQVPVYMPIVIPETGETVMALTGYKTENVYDTLRYGTYSVVYEWKRLAAE